MSKRTCPNPDCQDTWYCADDITDWTCNTCGDLIPVNLNREIPENVQELVINQHLRGEKP